LPIIGDLLHSGTTRPEFLDSPTGLTRNLFLVEIRDARLSIDSSHFLFSFRFPARARALQMYSTSRTQFHFSIFRLTSLARRWLMKPPRVGQP
jgi:hypothetical protein